MVYLDLKADFLPQKLNEFNQSKISFIENIQKMEGYSGFKEKPGSMFKMKIGWENMKLLKHFMETEEYKFFHGAIVTLSKSNSIEIIRSTKANDFTNV